MNWFAIYTKSRTEKKVADRLAECGVEVYCPTQTVLRQWSDRKKKVQVPVFSSYVFVRYKSEEERLKILQTKGVVAFVRYLGADARIRPEEIKAIKLLLEEFDTVEVVDFKAGDQVAITEGNLKGERGSIEKKQGDRVIIGIESLGLSLKAEVHASKVQKLKEADKGDISSKYHF